MHCKHCFFIIDESDDVCPNCGKPTKDEPVAVEEESDAIELPMKKEPEKVELSAEDQFTANFIQKDDPLAHVEDIKKNAAKTNKMMVVSRIAALLAVAFFIGVIYYTKVVLPKINQELAQEAKEAEDADKNPGYDTTTTIADNKLNAEIDVVFGDDTINTQLKNNNYTYSKEKQNVNVKLNYTDGLNGNPFQILIKRTYSSGIYDDSVSFKYGDASITGVIRTYSNYNEDLITNILNSYVVNKKGDLAAMYTKASTFQLGNPTIILLVKNGTYNKVEKVITTYSTDGVSITQCPITLTDSSISYCSIKGNFEKSKEVEINKIERTLDGQETIKETTIGLVAK